MGGYDLSKELIDRILEEIGLESIANHDNENELEEEIDSEKLIMDGRKFHPATWNNRMTPWL